MRVLNLVEGHWPVQPKVLKLLGHEELSEFKDFMNDLASKVLVYSNHIVFMRSSQHFHKSWYCVR